MRTATAGVVAFPAATLLPTDALAHSPAHSTGSGALYWDLSPEVFLPITIFSLLYGFGLVRLWRRAGIGRGIAGWRAVACFTGIAVLVIALMSPLEYLTGRLFWVHMVQHLLIMLVAPPLLVVGFAETALLWALPKGWRKGYGRFSHGLGDWLTGDRNAARNRVLVVALATGVLWVWHLPVLYDLAVRNELVHFAEHLGFIVTALLFWATVLYLRPRAHAANGLRMLSLFAMALQGSLLGALITFAGRPLYASYGADAGGISPLTDQQLAGLIMWIPPGLLYAGVAAYLFAQWLPAVGRRADVLREWEKA